MDDWRAVLQALGLGFITGGIARAVWLVAVEIHRRAKGDG